ncbi:wax ester/triacylglycerol synthase domain-containing protein [Streptomyces sp. URMC 123]|uniref:wax ester/triacylglycerol synthase domain-containing protein n=1 Tax=Streptomyces sp. URMC 123 TaxID=3423403 RepID=UPI003F1D6233
MPLFPARRSPHATTVPGPRRSPVDEAFDALARRAPRDEYLHNTHVLLLPGAPPTVAAVREHVARRAAAVPALAVVARSRRWHRLVAADPGAHVHEIALTDRLGGRDLLARTMLEQSLPAHGPRWGVWLVHGYADAEYALCYRSHHGFQDASAALFTLRALFGTPEDMPCALPGRDRLSWSAAARVIGDMALSFAPAGRVVRPAATPGSTRLVVRAEVDLRRLHALAVAARVSVNDVHLALTATAVTSWARAEALGPTAPHACVPLDLRVRGEAGTGLGNSIGVARVRLSDLARLLEDPDAADGVGARVRSVEYRAATRRLLALAPGPIARWVARHQAHPRHTSMIASRVVYPRRLAFGGQPVRDAFAIPSLLPGQLCFSTLTSLGRGAQVAFVADAALPGAEHLARRWAAALTRLEHAFRTAGSPTEREERTSGVTPHS